MNAYVAYYRYRWLRIDIFVDMCAYIQLNIHKYNSLLCQLRSMEGRTLNRNKYTLGPDHGF